MNKICTSLEQSKKLIELGISIDTADMCYYYDHNWSNEHIEIPKVWDNNYEQFIPESEEDDIPAWSLTALLGLMPFHIIENNNRFGFYQVKGFNKQGETYHFGYKTNNDSFLFETSWYNGVVDAAFEMVCWLKENGKI